MAFVGYSYSFGDVATDPSLPVFGVRFEDQHWFLTRAYLRTMSLWGRTSNLIVEVPYRVGRSTVGAIEDSTLRSDFSGFGDLGVTWSINLLELARPWAPGSFKRCAPRHIRSSARASSFRFPPGTTSPTG